MFEIVKVAPPEFCADTIVSFCPYPDVPDLGIAIWETHTEDDSEKDTPRQIEFIGGIDFRDLHGLVTKMEDLVYLLSSSQSRVVQLQLPERDFCGVFNPTLLGMLRAAFRAAPDLHVLAVTDSRLSES